MEPQMIYPTAPPATHAGEVEHVESCGKPEGMMSKVKRKARKLKDKIRKVAGVEGNENDHRGTKTEDDLCQHAPNEDTNEEGSESCEDDEEEHAHINLVDNKMFKTHDVACDALQAAPTKHHNYDEPLIQLEDINAEEIKTTTDISNDNVAWLAEDNNEREMNQQPNTRESPTSAEIKIAASPAGISTNSTTSDMNVTYLEDLGKSNSGFGHSSSSTYANLVVMNEDFSSHRKLDFSEDKGKGDVLMPECAELSGYRSSASQLMPMNAVERPVSNPNEGSCVTHPAGILDELVKELNGISQIECEPQESSTDGWNTNVDAGNVAKRVGSSDRAPSSQGDEFVDALSKPWDFKSGKKDADVAMRVGSHDTAPNLQVDEFVDAMSKSQDFKSARKDVDKDFYDPNDDKDDLFQEGSVEMPKSAAASTFGYGKEPAQKFLYNVAEDNAHSQNMNTDKTPLEITVDGEPLCDGGREHGGGGKEGYASSGVGDDASELHSPQPTGFFQGIKNMVASTLGYKDSEGVYTTETGQMIHDKVQTGSST